jgi:hypothetical protein
MSKGVKERSDGIVNKLEREKSEFVKSHQMTAALIRVKTVELF